ncbi:uncharacterized protein MELLADRAFT_111732 [Melampsora larici-populina 98AG31]|uniref:CCHC-type domain-containing protein n=1 Tax=Melampsora larici-populina (strain 98AG31 / pathotype 3-4-7) TaxID=747676 RepID=F4S4C8_MELLP|nr:uncharacterized protein MELLADRAFT_111732 [Melampsora larici-populina 98AG31]EGG00504.1 hypothetical protein MELLADRAFT_111732 [Melampsora larici-populina 98AG31]
MDIPDRQQSELNPIPIPDSAVAEVKAGKDQCFGCALFGHMQQHCPSRASKLGRSARPYKDWRHVMGTRKLYSVNVLWPPAPVATPMPVVPHHMPQDANAVNLGQPIAEVEIINGNDAVITAVENSEVHTAVANAKVEVIEVIHAADAVHTVTPDVIDSVAVLNVNNVDHNHEAAMICRTDEYVSPSKPSDQPITGLTEIMLFDIEAMNLPGNPMAIDSHKAFSPAEVSIIAENAITHNGLSEIVLFEGDNTINLESPPINHIHEEDLEHFVKPYTRGNMAYTIFLTAGQKNVCL